MQGLFLVSPWKPILVILPFIGWAWVVSTIYDKDALRWYFKRRAWNGAHLLVAIVSLGAIALAPSFWIGWPAMAVLLFLDLAVYAFLRNRDDRVPKHAKWSLNFSSMKDRSEQRKAMKLQKNVEVTFRGPNGVIPPPPKEAPEYDLRIAAESVLIDAMDGRANRFEIRPIDKQSYGLVYTVDGVSQAGKTIPQQQAIEVINFFKSAAGLDIQDLRRKLQGDIGIERAGAQTPLRVTTSGIAGGLLLRGQFDPEAQIRFDLDEVGLLPNQREELDRLIEEAQGVVLLAAPPYNGRTSSLYAILRAHDAYTTNVQTIELEPIGMIEGVRHNKFDPSEDGAEYSTTVRSILRRDPDVLAIAELPDAATAVEVTKADNERSRLYVGLRADNSMGAIQAFTKATNDPKAAGACLHGVIAQKLIRKLCPNCRAEYQPTPEMLKKLGVKPGQVTKLYRKGGQVLIRNKPDTCPVCQGSGYFGQEGVFEVFMLSDEERALIAKQDLVGLRAAIQKKRLPTIQESAIRKAIAGITSVEEVARITASSHRKPTQKAKPPAQPAPTQ